jgi:hypothetical protein
MSTRFRILVTAALVPILFILLNLVNPDIPEFIANRGYIVPLALAILEAVLVAWVVNLNLRGERIFTVLAFPAASIGVFVAFLEIVVRTSGNTLDRISTLLLSAVILGIVTYILTATINILNLSATKNIPLGQAGRAAHYVLTMIFAYFSFVLLVTNDVSFFLKLGIVFLMIFTYTFVALWTISLAYSQRIISAIGISSLLTFSFLIMGIWPLESFYFALFMVLIYYMCLGVALEIREIISSWIWYEYGAIFAVILIILLTTANWGVNGTIL